MAEMLISCDCSRDDYDAPRISRTSWVRARKQHTCGECHRTIARGESYELNRGYWDAWETHKTCLGCTRIREHFCSSGWVYGSVAGQIMDCVGFNYAADDEDDEDDDCGEPCRYGERCEVCEPYWQRMIAEGFWDVMTGWTRAGIDEMRKR